MLFRSQEEQVAEETGQLPPGDETPESEKDDAPAQQEPAAEQAADSGSSGGSGGSGGGSGTSVTLRLCDGQERKLTLRRFY